jgi:putative membrane protein
MRSRTHPPIPSDDVAAVDDQPRSESANDLRGVSANIPAVRTAGWIEWTLLAAGGVLFVVLLYQLGLRQLAENLALIGWGFVPIIGQEIIAITANTLGWWWAFPAPRDRVPLGPLVAARLAGDAINNLTPTATMGGELLRARMLAMLDPNAVWASVVIAKVGQALSQIVFIAAGLTLVLNSTPLPPGIRLGLFAGLALLTVGVGLAVVLQRRGMFTFLIGWARRFGLALPAHIEERLRELDAEVARFYRDPGALLASLACFFAGWVCGVVEIYLILYFLGLSADWQRALTIEILSTSIDAILFFVPAKAGTQEGGKVLIFTILGLDPAKGFALGIARRIRELFWSLVGLAFLGGHQRGRP